MKPFVVLLLGVAASLVILGQFSSSSRHFEDVVLRHAALAQESVELERDVAAMSGSLCATLQDPADGAEQQRLAEVRASVGARAFALQAAAGDKIGSLAAQLVVLTSRQPTPSAEIRRLAREIAQLAESEKQHALARSEELKTRAKVTAWVLIALLALVGLALPNHSITEKRSHHVR